MVSDVPLGAFLSGGIDSSLIVALMQVQSSTPVKTYTIGFHESEFDEGRYAKEVASHLGTDHTELYLSSEEVLPLISRLPELYNEPFADSSQIPTFLISQLARQHVTVALSGDGGDEIFGGYSRYFRYERRYRQLSSLPGGLRWMLAKAMKMYPTLEVFGKVLLPKLGTYSKSGLIDGYAEVLANCSAEEVYRLSVSHWGKPEDLVLGATEPQMARWDAADIPFEIQKAMYLDTVTYLPGDILTKVDRASMGVSLETRCPFLDYRVFEYAWRMPYHTKVRDGLGKLPLRMLLERYLPDVNFDRPKMGFAVPIDRWLRGPLREWAEALLSEDRIRKEGYFDTPAIRSIWDDHIKGKQDWSVHLWGILMFQSWLKTEISV